MQPAQNISLDYFFVFSPDIFCIIDTAGIIKKINPSFTNILKYSADDITNRKFIELTHPEDQSRTALQLNNALKNQNVRFENRTIAKDGSVHWLSWTFRFVPQNNLYYALAEDLTEVKDAKEKLKVQNRRLAEEKARNLATIENIGDGVVVVNDGGEITFVNQRGKEMLGLADNELVGKMIFHAIPAFDEKGNEIPVNLHPINQAFLGGKMVVSGNLMYRRKDGSKFAVSITSTPVHLQDALIGGVNVFRDITKEKEIDRMKTEFISLAAHQLRTPLSAMKWFSEMLIAGEAKPLTTEQKEIIDNIHKSNERMIELVNALLNISRIESGRIIVDPKPIDIKELADTVILELQPRIKDKNHKLTIEVRGELPKINVDQKLVRHVYINLLTNAIKYTPAGGTINVLISRSETDVVTQISDTGYGIPKEQQDRVFQKFFRGKNVAKVVTDGSGLGLYLAKAIVESSGGKIWFESQPGQGTIFWFSLPIKGSVPKDGEVSIDT